MKKLLLWVVGIGATAYAGKLLYDKYRPSGIDSPSDINAIKEACNKDEALLKRKIDEATLNQYIEIYKSTDLNNIYNLYSLFKEKGAISLAELFKLRYLALGGKL